MFGTHTDFCLNSFSLLLAECLDWESVDVEDFIHPFRLALEKTAVTSRFNSYLGTQN